MAYTNTHSIADLHAIPDVYPVAYTNIYTVANADSRADIHAVPDLYALAHVDTDTRAYRYCDTHANTDRDSVNAGSGHSNT